MSGEDEVVANFVALTGTDTKTAEGLLEACAGNLESAIQLFFDTQSGPAAQSDEALARSLQQPATSTSQAEPSNTSDEIRAPIPVVRDTLYGPTLYGQASSYGIRSQSRSRSHGDRQAQDLNAFRDFQAEGRGNLAGSNSGGLAHLFKAPSALMFQGTFDEAKAKAVQEGKWLMVNVQSNSQFASHMLNRDTWSDPTVSSILMGSFIFWQVYESSEHGSKFMSFYRIADATSLPIILILDPLTGAKQRQLTGFVEPQRLAEDLVPFMDHDIHHPSAHKLATQHKRKQTQAPPASKRPMTEDEELAAALAMSVEDAVQPMPSTSPPVETRATAPVPTASAPGPSGGSRATALGSSPSAPEQPRATALGSGPSASAQAPSSKVTSNGVSERENASGAANGASPQAADEASVIADAKARLPAEPQATDPSLCRIAIRLPDGKRLTRTFSRTDSVSALEDFCVIQAEGAATRPFKLMQPYPGAPPLTDSAQSLEAAGVAGGMVALKWKD